MTISLSQYLKERKSKLLDGCFNNIVSLYSESDYVKKEKDLFLNPVKTILKTTIKDIFAYLIGEKKLDDIAESLEQYTKLMALNGPKATHSLSPFFLLKQDIVKHIGDIDSFDDIKDELFDIINKFDCLTLKICDLFVQSREKIYEVRVNEVKRLTYTLLEANGLIEQIPPCDCDGQKNI